MQGGEYEALSRSSSLSINQTVTLHLGKQRSCHSAQTISSSGLPRESRRFERLECSIILSVVAGLPSRTNSPQGDRGCSGIDGCRSTLFHDPFQNHSATEFRLVSRKDKSDSSSLGFLLEDLNQFFLLIELRFIPPLKFAPAAGVMSEPFPELRTWGHLLQPQIKPGSFLGYAPRPKALDQNSFPIPPRGFLINSLKFDHERPLRHSTSKESMAHFTGVQKKPLTGSGSDNHSSSRLT